MEEHPFQGGRLHKWPSSFQKILQHTQRAIATAKGEEEEEEEEVEEGSKQKRARRIAAMKIRSINDGIVHKDIELIEPIALLIDTPEFQRLRGILQLGLGDRVFPAATHTRFLHSLGTYYWARKYLDRLLATHQGAALIDERDQLCVCIAALLHDIGHGPYSHLYDTFLCRMHVTGFRSSKDFQHEQQSIRVLRRMLERNTKLRDELCKYLQPEDFTFIEELIDPPCWPFVAKSGDWQLRGRPREKAFLYDIVSNKLHGLDVDKMDYYLRDSRLNSIGIQFNRMTAERVMKGTLILHDEKLDHPILVFNEKNTSEIVEAFQCRASLHRKLYKHKTCVAIEWQMIEILAAADPHIKFPGDDGELYTMSTAWKDIGAFLRMRNSVEDLIRNSTSDELSDARRMLDDLDCRKNIPKLAREISLDPQSYALAENGDLNVREIERSISARLVELEPALKSSSYLVVVLAMHQGLGISEYPMKHVRLYRIRDDGLPQSYTVGEKWVSANCPPSGFLTTLIYRMPGIDRGQADSLESAVKRFQDQGHNSISVGNENNNE